MKPIAVVLAGSGRADGSEIHEAVSVLVHLSRHGVKYQCFAPNQPQTDVVDHASGKPMQESRNCLVEAARISRGDIRDIKSLHAADFAGVVFPGGFGAAKNLCSFAKDGATCSVQPDVARVLMDFAGASKPIGLICIAPVLGAAVFGRDLQRSCSITLGADAGNDAAAAATKMGARHVAKRVTEALVDETNRIVTTPAYMCDATPFEVFTGIGVLVDEVVRLAK